MRGRVRVPFAGAELVVLRDDDRAHMCLWFASEHGPLDGCWPLIDRGDEHVALVAPGNVVLHRYCLECAMTIFGWPR